MGYKLTKKEELLHKDKFGISLDVYPVVNDSGYVIGETNVGHNQEFYDTTSTFTYFILEGDACFVLDDQEVYVVKGDCLSIAPQTRLYFKGKMKWLLVTTPKWRSENEVETKAKVW